MYFLLLELVSIYLCLCSGLSVSKTETPDGAFPYSKQWAYHTGASNYRALDYFFDGSTESKKIATLFGSNWVLNDSSSFVFTFPANAGFELKEVDFFDGPGEEKDPAHAGVLYYYKKGSPVRIFLDEWNGSLFNEWKKYLLPAATVVEAVELVVKRPAGSVVLPTEIRFLGQAKNHAVARSMAAVAAPVPANSFRRHLSENFYPYSLQSPRRVNEGIDSVKGNLFASLFTTGRFYVDWRWLEPYDPRLTGGYSYTFESSHNGGWRFDDCLQFLKDHQIDVIFDVKDIPDYIKNTYPRKRTDVTPLLYDSATYAVDRAQPASYIYLANLLTQLTIRYGRNKDLPLGRTRMYRGTVTKWKPSLSENTPRAGLDLLHTIEVGNELNRNWAGFNSYLAPEEYAALLSACYDGDKGRLGDTVGIKTIDSSMQVAMMGMVGINPGYLLAIYRWSARHRGYKSDGSIDLPFDIIKFHCYTSDAGMDQTNERTRGACPESVPLDTVFRDIKMLARPAAKGGGNPLPLVIGEYGYDINNSKQQALTRAAQGGKGRLERQADWLLRTILCYMELGISSSSAYQYADDGNAKTTPDGQIDTLSPAIQYLASGIVTRADTSQKRPAAWVFQQLKQYFANWEYDGMLA
ncbi:MAG: hypothetical protein QM664_11975, partial [Flavihumibacter sp.]